MFYSTIITCRSLWFNSLHTRHSQLC